MRSFAQRGKAYLNTVLLRNPAGRHLTVFPNDIFLVTYPRSGSTWSRFLFGNLLLTGQTVNFANVDWLVPTIYDHPDRVLRSLPRVLKSHECFDPRYPRVIHIVRDPRDVAASFYYYNLKVRVLPDGYPIGEFIDRFLAVNVVEWADRLGSWEDHTRSWQCLRQGKNNYCLIRYEDLVADPARELLKTASLLQTDLTPSRIERAVQLSSANEMRSMEREQWKKWTTTKDSRGDIPFVREAKSGGWRKHISESSARKIELAWGSTMQELGYELTCVS
jgi:hypothetical protein